MTESARLSRERRTIATMVEMYCRGRHGSAALCGECGRLLNYAMARVDRCPFGADKPTCARCPVHCYRSAERAEIRRVMRWSGPRMAYRHPILTIRHYLDELRRGRPARPAPRSAADRDTTENTPDR